MSKVDKAKEVYAEYVLWFNKLAATPEGCAELRQRKAFSKYADSNATPEPYPFQLWYLYDRNSGVDEAAMERRAQNLKSKNRYNISKASQHVGGNINNPLLNPEYIENARKWKEANEEGRRNDLEWQAHDRLTNEVQTLHDSNPTMLNEWVSKSKTTVAPVEPVKPPGMFKRILRRLVGLGGNPTPSKARDWNGWLK